LHLIISRDNRACTHTHTLGRIPLDEGSARCRDLYRTTTQYSRQTDSHASGGIRNRNFSNRGPQKYDL